MDEKYFKILEINNDATLEEVKQAYRDLAQIWHPDTVSTKNPRLKDKADEKMKELNEAKNKIIAFLTEKQGGKTEEGNEWEQAARERAEIFKNAEQTRKKAEEDFFQNRADQMADKAGAKEKRGNSRSAFLKFLVIFLSVLMVSVGIHFSFWKKHNKAIIVPPVVSQRFQPPEAVPEKPITEDAKKSIKKQPPLIPVRQGQDTKRIDSETLSMKHTEDALKQLLIHKIDNTITEAENHLMSREYMESKKSYESALNMVLNSQYRKENLFLARKRKIEEALLRKDIVYGSQGFVRYGNKWISPDEYQKNYVKFKGSMRHYKELEDVITQITDPQIGIYLIYRYKDQNIRHKKIDCYKLELYRKNPSSSHFKVYYQWEVWTFSRIENGVLSLDVEYYSETDRWQIGEIYEED